MKRNKLGIILFICLFSVGILCLSYPTVSNFIYNITNQGYIEDYNESISNAENIEEIYINAKVYNETLAKKHYLSTEEENRQKILNEYNVLLNFNNNGIMGYIEIPKIDVKLQIYHGISEVCLEKGAIHLENTSLPIGGENTHCAISAHSGYPTQKFFDDLEDLENGDIFYINVLDKKLKYKVYSIDIVEPDKMSFEILENKDIVTLVTCYPFSINSHRLLVHGERVVEATKASEDEIETVSTETANYLLITSLIIVAVAIFLIMHIRRLKIKKETEGS